MLKWIRFIECGKNSSHDEIFTGRADGVEWCGVVVVENEERDFDCRSRNGREVLHGCSLKSQLLFFLSFFPRTTQNIKVFHNG